MIRTDQVLHATLDRTTLEEPARSETISRSAGPASVVRSSGTAIAGGLVSQALKAVVMIYVARVFGASEFGSFSFAFSVNAFLFVIAQFGLPVYGAREVAQTGRLERGLFTAISEARLLLATSGMAVALVVLHFARVTSAEFWLVAGFGLSNVALSGFSDWAFQGMGRIHFWAALNISWQGLWLILTVALVQGHVSIALIAFAYATAAFVAALIGWSLLRRLTQPPSEPAPVLTYSVWSVIGAGANLGAATLFMPVLSWTDTIIVRWVLGQHSAGVYAAGNRVALALAMLAGFYVQGAFPELSHSAMSSLQEHSKAFQRAFEDLAFLFIPGSVWALFYAPQIMMVVFNNPEYVAGATVFRIFQVFLLLNVFINLYGMGALVAYRRDHAYRTGYGMSAAALLVLCPILTVWWGIVGAALAALSIQILNLALFMTKSRHLLKTESLKALGLPAVIAVIPILLGKVFHLGFWVSGAALALTYLAIFVWRRPVLYPVVK